MKRVRRLRVLVAVLWLAGTVNVARSSEEMPVPTDAQGILFKKILAYDRTLQESGGLEVLVVKDGRGARALADDVVEAFEAVGLDARLVAAEDVEAMLSLGSVVYFPAGVETEAVSALCASRGVLTISGMPALAESGQVAIALGTKDDKPEIIIHLDRVKAEGHELSSDLLKLSRLIR